MTPTYVLTLSCPDQSGIVARIAGELFNHGANVEESQQYNDPGSELFFMRVKFAHADVNTFPDLATGIEKIAQSFSMTYKLRASADRPRVLLMVSKFDHCLVDLIYRTRIGELQMDIVGVVSNHDQASANLNMMNGITFWKLPVTPDTKSRQEAELKNIVKDLNVDLVVLARYMQILSTDLSAWLHGRCINIHHSFLPGFKGARPYHQAYDRGVKMIGATAHYVTADLDEGPIIVQDVEAISHSDRPEDLVRKGRDIERRVLARAVQHHIEDRVLLNGAKTVVFTA